MGSSRKAKSKILGVVTPTRAKVFLTRLANRSLDKDSAKLRLAYPEMVEPLPDSWEVALSWVQIYLRLAWDTPDERYREWYLHEMRRHYRDSVTEASFRQEEPKLGPLLFSAIPAAGIDRDLVDERLIRPPVVTPFEGAAFYFQSRVGNLAKHCQHSECAEPYFIADKRWQKFCSEACAGPANRESKRKWWRENKARGGVR